MAPRLSKSAPRKPKAAKQIFAHLEFVLCGEFEGPERSHANITRWITTHGGIVSPDVTPHTDYVICTMQSYEKKVPEVKAALKLGDKACKIVTYDFIEDCLLHKGGPRLLKNKDHYCKTVLANVRREKKEMIRKKQNFEDDGENARELVNPRLYGHAIDRETARECKYVISRITMRPKVTVEKYTLFLFESHAIPKLYMFGAKFNMGSRPTAFHRENLIPTEYDKAFENLKSFFRSKTGVNWEDRFQTHFYKEEEFRWLPNTVTSTSRAADVTRPHSASGGNGPSVVGGGRVVQARIVSSVEDGQKTQTQTQMQTGSNKPKPPTLRTEANNNNNNNNNNHEIEASDSDTSSDTVYFSAASKSSSSSSSASATGFSTTSDSESTSGSEEDDTPTPTPASISSPDKGNIVTGNGKNLEGEMPNPYTSYAGFSMTEPGMYSWCS